MSNSTQMHASHGFLLMGTNDVFGCHLPMFFMPAHAFQVIFELAFNDNDKETYLRTKKENPGKPLIVQNTHAMSLEEMAKSESFKCFADFANNNGDPIGNKFIESTTVTVKKNILFEPLSQNNDYPENLAYYLYGKNSEYHLSHVLTKAPNFQQELDIELTDEMVSNIKNLHSEITKIHIPSLNEENGHPFKSDPLTESEYPLMIDNDGGMAGSFKVLRRYWINNNPLNDGLEHHNMDGMDHHHMNM